MDFEINNTPSQVLLLRGRTNITEENEKDYKLWKKTPFQIGKLLSISISLF